MDPIVSFRIRQFLAIIAAALVTAAAIRHFAHVSIGLSREEIRNEALMAAVFVGALLALFFFRNKWRP
jgi:hypothetical protein